VLKGEEKRKYRKEKSKSITEGDLRKSQKEKRAKKQGRTKKQQDEALEIKT